MNEPLTGARVKRHAATDASYNERLETDRVLIHASPTLDFVWLNFKAAYGPGYSAMDVEILPSGFSQVIAAMGEVDQQATFQAVLAFLAGVVPAEVVDA